jgi:hypothetical protein
MVEVYDAAIEARDAKPAGSDAWKKLDAGATALLDVIRPRQDNALTEAKWKGKTRAESNMEGLEDLASRTREEQLRIIGAPVAGISKEKAADFDRKKVSLAMKGSFREHGAQMMADQLEGADEAQQLKLLQRLSDPSRDHLSTLIAHSGENVSNAQAMADAIRNAKGAARQLLIDRLAASIKGPDHPMIQRLGVSPTFQENFQVSASLVTALKKAGKTDAANALMGATAKELGALRGDFEKQKKVVDALNAEFSRTVTGFAGAVDPKAVEKYRDAFVAKHKAAFDKYEQTAGRYMDAFKMAASGAFGELDFNPLSDSGKLRTEVTLASSMHGDALLNPQSGQKALDDAMKLQLLKEPSWLDNRSTKASAAKTYLELPQKMAEISA